MPIGNITYYNTKEGLVTLALGNDFSPYHLTQVASLDCYYYISSQSTIIIVVNKLSPQHVIMSINKIFSNMGTIIPPTNSKLIPSFTRISIYLEVVKCVIMEILLKQENKISCVLASLETNLLFLYERRKTGAKNIHMNMFIHMHVER